MDEELSTKFGELIAAVNNLVSVMQNVKEKPLEPMDERTPLLKYFEDEVK